MDIFLGMSFSYHYLQKKNLHNIIIHNIKVYSIFGYFESDKFKYKLRIGN